MIRCPGAAFRCFLSHQITPDVKGMAAMYLKVPTKKSLKKPGLLIKPAQTDNAKSANAWPVDGFGRTILVQDF